MPPEGRVDVVPKAREASGAGCEQVEARSTKSGSMSEKYCFIIRHSLINQSFEAKLRDSLMLSHLPMWC